MFAVIFLAASAVSALAISIDGMIAPDEMTDCNIEVQCSNEKGGNGIYRSSLILLCGRTAKE